MATSEICKCCGAINAVGFAVSDEVWDRQMEFFPYLASDTAQMTPLDIAEADQIAAEIVELRRSQPSGFGEALVDSLNGAGPSAACDAERRLRWLYARLGRLCFLGYRSDPETYGCSPREESP